MLEFHVKVCNCLFRYENTDNFVSLKDPVTTTATTINAGAIVASVLGGALFTLIVGLVVFFIWKRRVKKKSFAFSPSISTETTSSTPVVVPALYDMRLSGRESTATSAPTLTYHLYDELP
jgi:heme/copper-type cytochrome/quinol oxidase subunit 2